MFRIFGALLLSVLFLGCRQGAESTREAMVLCGSVGGVSKTEALTAGDEVAVFARIDGTETYFLEAAKFTTGSDGMTLSATPAVYYPERKQAVRFYAYFPYHTGVFSVPTDQSTATALKQADLCWATTPSTPVPTPVSLSFGHQMARLVVSATEPIEQITVPNAYIGGTLDVATGVFRPTTKSDLSTTGNELILPTQPLTRLVLTVSGVDYVFEQPFTLQSGQTTTLNLTFNPTTKTATLAGSSIAPWGEVTNAGSPKSLATNRLTFMWVPAHPRAAQVDKIVMTIQNEIDRTTANYTIDGGITLVDRTFVFSFAATALSYPYTIKEIQLYRSTELIQRTDRILAGTVYKSGAYTIGVNGRPVNPPQPNQIFYFDGYGTPTYWTRGFLVAKSGSSNECVVGGPTDMGLYFQFGSLIGWNGAKTADGTGFITSYTQALPVACRVYPIECFTPPTTFARVNYNDLNHFYFGLQAAPYNGYADIRQYPGITAHQYAPQGVGDPCSYYLGEPWRLPTDVEVWALWRRPRESSTNFAWTSDYAWNGSSYIGSGNVQIYNAGRSDYMTIMASGVRYPNWSSSTGTGPDYAVVSHGSSNTFAPTLAGVFVSAAPALVSSFTYHVNGYSNGNYRVDGIPVRCVHN